jgi:transcription termination/antitermination protein NusG
MVERDSGGGWECIARRIQPRHGSPTEGGEALAATVLIEDVSGTSADHVSERQWFVLWTRSHCEQLVHDQLSAKGLHPFLPTIDVWSRRAHVRQRIRIPMFPGYLFLHEALDKHRDVEVRKARGLVAILGEGGERRAVVPPHEVQAIRRVVDARVAARPHPYLKQGQRVRILRGPMADVEGVFLRIKENKGLLVLSVDMLQRSVAVEVDCTLVAPI